MENEDMEKGKMPSDNTDLTPEKAKKMLEDNSAHGHPLTDQQKKYFGVIAGQDDKKD
jgi:hypothetical protein